MGEGAAKDLPRTGEREISFEDAAADLGLETAALRAAIAHDHFAATKVGETWVTTRDEVERYRRENLREPDLTSMDAEGDGGQVFGG